MRDVAEAIVDMLEADNGSSRELRIATVDAILETQIESHVVVGPRPMKLTEHSIVVRNGPHLIVFSARGGWLNIVGHPMEGAELLHVGSQAHGPVLDEIKMRIMMHNQQRG